jgi:hypothetical protein
MMVTIEPGYFLHGALVISRQGPIEKGRQPS